MIEDKKIINKPQGASGSFPAKRVFRARRPAPKRAERAADEFEQKIIDLARVTRVMAGGKRMKFRACMIVGDKKGRVGMGLAKGADVAMAISKAVTKAKKSLISVPIVGSTIPHEVKVKFGSAKILIKPAKAGSGIKAGGVLRIILELAGVKDIVAKILGNNNKINNAQATMMALKGFLPKALEARVRPVVKKEASQQPAERK